MKLIPRTFTDMLFVGVLFIVPIFSLAFDHVHISLWPKEQIATSTPVVINPFSQISIDAKAAYVWDIQNQKVLFSKNSNIPMPLASITKVMTSLVALENASDTTEVTFKADYLKPEGDSGFLIGEVWKLKQLIDFTLVSSSNDGAQAMASATEALQPDKGTFVSLMNTEAHALNLNSMSFKNPTGLDENLADAGAYGSAEDLAKLYEYILKNHPEIFEATNKPRITVSSDTTAHTATNTNIVANQIPGLIGSKTGFTDIAGGNLAVLVDAGIQHPVAIVVLGSTSENRFSDVQNLTDATYKYLTGL